MKPQTEPTLRSRSPLLAAASVIFLASCGGGYGGMGYNAVGSGSGMSCMGMYTSCMAPTITLASPGMTVNRTVTLTASVSAMGGATGVRVDFMVDGASVGTASQAPYTVRWDSSTVTDGAHTLTATVSDSQGMSVSAAPVTIQVDNNPAFNVAMSPAQIIPAPASSAAGTAALSAKLANGALSGKVLLSGVTATAVTINEAFAGNSGAALIMLTASGGTAGEWDVPAGALLSADQVTALLQGKLYVIATSAVNPQGEVRGQITPANVMVSFSGMSGMQEVPPVSIVASGVAATTVDSSANTLTMHVRTTGVADATAADVGNGASGTMGAQLAALGKDSVDMGHWSTELTMISAADVANFNAGRWYANVSTPADPNGAIRGQIAAH